MELDSEELKSEWLNSCDRLLLIKLEFVELKFLRMELKF